MNVTIEALKTNDIKDIIVADSHGPMVNLKIGELPKCVHLVRGTPRPISMVNGVKHCDLAIFLGYHSKAGTRTSRAVLLFFQLLLGLREEY